ncbi:MAG: hypothetical protein AAF328_06990, partial [Planctomycetota bacterium]
GDAFPGFTPLDANYLYCPNQFFDVVLPNASRGTLRIIAFLLRKTLGWLDDNGQPVDQRITASYKELIEKAGVSRGALRPALDDALKLKAIRCTQKGKPNEKGKAGHAASYELRWDHPEAVYTRRVAEFRGFFAGEGHRSPIPNGFFDVVIPGETLATVQTVGAVLRHTVGYQNQFGGRRQHAALSYDYLQQYTRIASRRHLAAALRRGLEGGYLRRVREGTFHPDAARRQSAQYGIRWLGQPPTPDALTPSADAPSGADRSKKAPGAQPATVQKGNQPFRGKGSKRTPTPVAETRAKKGTSQRSRKTPVQAFNKDTDRNDTLKNTHTNNAGLDHAAAVVGEGLDSQGLQTSQSQSQSADAVIAALREAGLGPRVAARLVADFGPAACGDQLAWLPARNPRTNPAGMLRRAIEQAWDAPGSPPSAAESHGITDAERFAAHAYAAMNGHAGQPIAEPSVADCEYAQRVLIKLKSNERSAASGDSHGDRDKNCNEEIQNLGRSFGRFVRHRRAGTLAKFGTVASALRMHGDAWAADRLRSVSPRALALDASSEPQDHGLAPVSGAPDPADTAVAALIARAETDPAAAAELAALKAEALADCPAVLSRKLIDADPADSRNLRRLMACVWEARHV